MSRVARGLSLVAGGGSRAANSSSPAFAGEGDHAQHGGGALWRSKNPSTTFGGPPPREISGRMELPQTPHPTLSELFAASPRDGGWAGFLLPQLGPAKPLLWVQERMAILEAGRLYPAGLGGADLIHVEARDARSALWAMEEGLRCSSLSAVIGEIWADPTSLDFTATRRLAVAAERSAVPCWLVRLRGTANTFE